MPLHSLLFIFSSLGAAATAQDASLDTQLVTPVYSRPAMGATLETSDDRVSVHFHDAKASEVLAWLEDHRVNFVVATGELPTGLRVTLSIQDESVDSVANAIARALGGHWDREGGVRVFRRDLGNPMVIRDLKPGLESHELPDGDQIARQIEEQTRQLQLQFGPDFQRKMEEQSKMLADQFGPKFQAQMAEQSKRIAEQAKQFQKQFGPDFERKMDGMSKQLEKQFGPDYERKMERQSKQFSDQFGPKFEAEMEEQAKKIAEQAKQLQKQFGPDFEQRMEGQSKQLAEQAKRLEKQFGPDFERKMEGDSKRLKDQFGPESQKKLHEQTDSLKKFMRSLTPAQHGLLKKNGSLHWHELTPDQQKMLAPWREGASNDGTMILKYQEDGNSVTVKGD
jgi:hypothetical protein